MVRDDDFVVVAAAADDGADGDALGQGELLDAAAARSR